jgi:hypothetical protein
MAAFIYLGFVAAGEEIEQPFGTSLIILSNQFVLTRVYFQAMMRSIFSLCEFHVACVSY